MKVVVVVGNRRGVGREARLAVQFTLSGLQTIRVSISEKYQNICINLENRGQRHRVLRIV